MSNLNNNNFRMMRKNILLILTIFCFSTLLVAQSNDCSYGGTGLTVGSSCTTVTFNSNNNTDYWNSASGCAAGDDDDAWWWFTATSTSTTITYNSSDDAILHLFTGTCSTTMSHIACADNTTSGNETIIFSTTIGTNYAIRIQRYNSSNNMSGNICVYNTPVAAGCTPNTTIASVPYIQTGFNTAGAGDDFSSSDACGSSYMGGDDYVFTYTPSANECVSIALTNTSTWVGVFLTDGCPTTGTCVASNTNSSGNPSISSVNLTAGITYFITVSTFPSPQTTPFDISIIACPPPPSNDECSGATAVTVNPDLNCGSVTAGTIQNTTGSAQSNTCSGTANDDVWYSFVATGTVHTVDLLNVSGSPTDMYHSVYAGACGSIGAPLVCSDPNNSTVSGLTPGNTYYIRVYSYSSSTGATTTFNVCVGTPPPPPANDNCSGAISLTMSIDGSCNSVSSSVTGAYDSGISSACFGTPNDDVWFSFVATDDTAYVDRIANFDSEIEVFDGCSGTSIDCQDSESSLMLTGLTVGNTYYVRVYSYSSFLPSDGDFTICVFGPAPPPENDLCSKMQPICADSPYSFIATEGGDDASTTEPGNDYDCLSTSPNPTWFYLEIDTGGVMSFDITAADDIDFALWGPYSSLANAQAACGSLPTPIDCSYSSTNIEQANANVSAGDVFILLVTNYADVQQPITLNSSSANTASTDCTILPIELMSFDANASEHGNELSWQTLSEINNDYFILETSKDARNFQAIGSVKGAGNSNELLSYYLMDKNPIASITYYRLKQVDFDGKFSYSDIVSVRRIDDGEVVISPNPVKNVLNIELKTIQAENYNFMVVDLLGAVIEKNIHLNKGTNNIKLDVFADLPQGFYMLKIVDENNTIITTKKIVKN